MLVLCIIYAFSVKMRFSAHENIYIYVHILLVRMTMMWPSPVSRKSRDAADLDLQVFGINMCAETRYQHV